MFEATPLSYAVLLRRVVLCAFAVAVTVVGWVALVWCVVFCLAGCAALPSSTGGSPQGDKTRGALVFRGSEDFQGGRYNTVRVTFEGHGFSVDASQPSDVAASRVDFTTDLKGSEVRLRAAPSGLSTVERRLFHWELKKLFLGFDVVVSSAEGLPDWSRSEQGKETIELVVSPRFDLCDGSCEQTVPFGRDRVSGKLLWGGLATFRPFVSGRGSPVLLLHDTAWRDPQALLGGGFHEIGHALGLHHVPSASSFMHREGDDHWSPLLFESFHRLSDQKEQQAFPYFAAGFGLKWPLMVTDGEALAVQLTDRWVGDAAGWVKRKELGVAGQSLPYSVVTFGDGRRGGLGPLRTTYPAASVAVPELSFSWVSERPTRCQGSQILNQQNVPQLNCRSLGTGWQCRPDGSTGAQCVLTQQMHHQLRSVFKGSGV